MSDNRASYKRIGFTVFIGIAAIVGTLIYLGGMSGRTDEVLVETYHDKPVSGLSVGSAVNFRGVNIGEVREISFVGNKYEARDADNSRIFILMAIRNAKLVRGGGQSDFLRSHIRMFVEKRGLRATVTTSGITGLSRIELDFTNDTLDDVPPISWVPNRPYVPAKVSLLENFSVAATKVMNQINRMDLASTWSNVSHSVESIARVAEVSENLMLSRQGDIERILDNITTVSSDLKELSAELKRNPSLLVRERTQRPLAETE